MHTTSITFYYIGEAAVRRHCNVWFRELGGTTTNGSARVVKLLEEIFRDVWIPEMVAFITTQHYRAAGRGSRSHAVAEAQHGSADEDADRDREHLLVEQWRKSPEPFSWKYVARVCFFVAQPTYYLWRQTV